MTMDSFTTTTMISSFINVSSHTSSSTTDIMTDEANHPPFYNVCPNDSAVWPLVFLSDEALADMGLLYNMGQYLLVNYLMPFIILCGIIGNGIFLLSLARIREMRTITAFYLANLAFADLFFLVSVVIRTFSSCVKSTYMYTDPFRSGVGCSISRTITYMCYFGSIGFVTLVTFERYVSICHPVKHRLIKSQRRTVKLVLATWAGAAIIGVGLGAVNITGLTKYCIIWPLRPLYKDLPKILTFCNATSKSISLTAYLLQTSAFLITLVMNVGMYGCILRKIGGNRVGPIQISSGQGPEAATERPVPNNANRVRNSVAKMLIVIGVTFFVCLTPWQFNVFQNALSLLGIEMVTENEKILIFVGTAMNSLNSAVNPLIYSLTNPRYRMAFWRAVSCRKIGDNRDLVSNTGTQLTAPTSN